VGYLEVVKGGEQQSRKVKLPRVLHPSLEYVSLKEMKPIN